jgi:large subunit ribosomal protein L10
LNRAEKTAAIDRLSQDFSRHPHLVLATFQRLTVNQANELRRKVRGVGGRYQVIKNRLARRAAAGTGAESLAPRFRGPCAVAMHESDPIALAKVLADFAKDNPQIELAGGVVDAKVTLDAEGVRRLATLPPLPELRAQLLRVIQSPATTLVRLLSTPGTQLARAIDARREKLQD